MPNGDQTLTLRVHGECLDVTNSGTANGTLVQLFACNFGLAQKWVVNGTALVNPNSGRCLSTATTGDPNGAGFELLDCGGTANDQFWVLPR